MAQKLKATEATADQSQPQLRFEVLKVYIKDASFEAPATPQIFLKQNVKPEIGVEVLIDYKSIDSEQDFVEVVLDITITSKMAEETMYLAEVHQAGIFQIKHPKKDAKRFVIEVTAPHLLLPFAREALNSLITKGGFHSFLLTPINFEAIYRDKLKREEEMNQKATSETPESIN